MEERSKHTGLNDIYQCAYHTGQSTLTDLLKVHSGIAETLDEGSLTALIMFDSLIICSL